MVILNNLVSAFYNISFIQPEGLWEALILNVFNWGFLANYGWRVLVFTLCLKLLLSPIDIYQRVSMRKTQKVTEKLSYSLDKLEKQYANDEKLKAQKKQELLQKNGAGMNPLKTCLPMLVTLIVFITLFSGLRVIGAYKNADQYAQYYNEYKNVYQCVVNNNEVTLAKDGNPSSDRVASYQQSYIDGMGNYVKYLSSLKDPVEPTDPAKPAGCDDIITAYESATNPTFVDLQNFAFFTGFSSLTAEEQAYHVNNLASYVGSSAVHKIYNDVVEDFLWIKNIWAVDAPWESSVSNYQNFDKNTRYAEGFMGCGSCMSQPSYLAVGKMKVNDELGITTTEQKSSLLEDMKKQETYNMVMRDLLSDPTKNTANGYLVLPILSVILAFLTTFMSQGQQKKSGQAMEGQNGMSMKLMTWMMPLLIGFFSFQYTASFALYLVVSYLVSLLVNLVMMIIYRVMDKKENDVDVIKYGRPNFNDSNNDTHAKPKN